MNKAVCLFAIIALLVLNSNVNGLNLAKNPLINQVLVISFDGFSVNKLDEYLKDNANSTFSSFINEGIRAEYMQPSFPSATFPNHYTLVTGLYPESHGIVGNDLYDPLYDTKIELQTAADRLNPKWWNQAEPLWLTAKSQGLKTGTLFWAGSDVNNRNADVWMPYNQAYPFASRVNDVINWITKLKLDLTFLYFDEPDSTGHNYGPDTVEYMQKIKDLDVLIGSFIASLKELGIYDQLNIVIVSDHGMTQFKSDNAIMVQNFLDITKINLNKTIFGIVSSIYATNGSEQYVYDSLKKIPNINVYWRNEIPEEYHYRNNPRISPIVAVANEGYRLVVFIFLYFGHTMIYVTLMMLFELKTETPRRNGGHHGYNNSLPSMRGIFLARGPSFERGKVLKGFTNVNVYPLICKLTETKCNGNNGSINVFSGGIVDTSSFAISTHGSIFNFVFSLLLVFKYFIF